MFFKKRTTFSFITALLALSSFILFIWALWSTFWVEALVSKDDIKLNATLPLRQFYGTNPHDADDPGAFQGWVYFGLFRGCKKFNHGFGGRQVHCFSIFNEHKEVYSVGIVVAVIVLIFIAILFALIATVFGLVNTLALPIETIYGPVGLYIWNGIAAVSSLLAAIIYTVFYLVSLRSGELLNLTDREYPYFFKTNTTNLGFSYILFIVGVGLLFFNMIFVALAQYTMDPNAFKSKKTQAPTYNNSEASREYGSGLMY